MPKDWSFEVWNNRTRDTCPKMIHKTKTPLISIVSHKKLINHSRLFFSHSTVID